MVRSVMREQKQESEWTLSCQMRLTLKWDAPRICVAQVFAFVVDVVNELTRDGVLCKLLYADDLMQISETIEGLIMRLIKWKNAFESKILKVKPGKIKVMVSGRITKDGLS